MEEEYDEKLKELRQ